MNVTRSFHPNPFVYLQSNELCCFLFLNNVILISTHVSVWYTCDIRYSVNEYEKLHCAEPLTWNSPKIQRNPPIKEGHICIRLNVTRSWVSKQNKVNKQFLANQPKSQPLHKSKVCRVVVIQHHSQQCYIRSNRLHHNATWKANKNKKQNKKKKKNDYSVVTLIYHKHHAEFNNHHHHHHLLHQ